MVVIVFSLRLLKAYSDKGFSYSKKNIRLFCAFEQFPHLHVVCNAGV